MRSLCHEASSGPSAVGQGDGSAVGVNVRVGTGDIAEGIRALLAIVAVGGEGEAVGGVRIGIVVLVLSCGVIRSRFGALRGKMASLHSTPINGVRAKQSQ